MMNKKKKATLVPRLRFPEFSNAQGWNELEIGKIFYNRQEVGFLSLPLMSLTDEYGIIPQIDSSKKDTSNSNKSKYLRICVGDIVYNTMRMWQGRCAYSFLEGIVSPAYTVCTPKNGNNGLFFYYYFKTFNMIRRFHANSQGLVNDTLNLKYDAFSKIYIACPRGKEQQKIADCLSSLDDLIAAEGKNLDLLKAHKRGLMQKLFPAEGETVPEWRFPEFSGRGDWSKEEINSIGEIVTGKTPDTTKESLWNGDIQFITPTDISESKYQLKTQRTVVNNDKIKILPKNSILFTCIASIGKMAISVYPCITNQQINAIIPYKSYNNEYIYYALLKKIDVIKSALANTALPIINKTEFSKFTLTVPEDPKEQQRIVDCLSTLDTFITAQAEKIEALKSHKKGLMQGLFPSVEETSE